MLQLFQAGNLASRLGMSWDSLRSLSGFGRKQSQDLVFHSFLYSEQEPGTTGEAVVLYINQAHPGIGSSQVSGKQDTHHYPLESRALPLTLVSLPQMHKLASLSLTSLPRGWALSLPPPQESVEALGMQWGSPCAESSWPFTGAASPFTRGQMLLLGHWHPAGAGRAEPGTQMAEQSTSWLETQPQTGGIEGGPLVGCLGTGQGHPGLPSCLERRN